MPKNEPRLSAQTLKVLAALLAAKEELPGAKVGKQAKLKSGTLYPILWRLEEAGWICSRWEEGEPAELGRPLRRYYRITGLGAARTRMAYEELSGPFGKFAWT